MTKRQLKELENSSEDHRAFTWLKESNNKLRHDLKHVCHSTATNAYKIDTDLDYITRSTQDRLVEKTRIHN
jgi:hypothetical protein